jgi:hypothetical protein
MKKRARLQKRKARPEITFRPENARATSKPTQNSSGLFRLFICVIFLLLIGGFLAFFAFFRRSWDGKTDRNIVFVPEVIDGFKGKIIFTHISPQNHTIDVALLNPELSLQVLGGYGEYPLRSLYPFLKLEKKSPAFIQAAYSFGLTKIVDEVATSKEMKVFTDTKDLQFLFKELLQLHVQSGLSVTDRVWLYRFYLGLRPDQVKIYEVNSFEEWEKVSGNIRFPAEAKDCAVSVINTTATSGVGSALGRVLEKSGYVVIRVSDVDKPQDKTMILTDDTVGSCQTVIQHLQRTLPYPAQVSINADVYQQYRSNIVILVGKDVADAITKQKK